jgi:hypothetical protein
MVVTPLPRDVTIPELSTCATFVFDDFHVTEPVTFLLLPSTNVPVAMNCSDVPGDIALPTGTTWIDCMAGSDFEFPLLQPNCIAATTRRKRIDTYFACPP